MMAIDVVPYGDGARVVRLNSTEKDIVIPEKVNGHTVRSLGPCFLKGTPGSGGRTLRIPGTVTDVDREALTGVVGLGRVCFDGDIEVFNAFGVMAEHDCELECTASGRRFTFQFNAGTVMSFPDFDDSVLGSMFRMNPDIAVARLSDPVLLSAENRDRYRRYLSDRIIPKAEQAVASGDSSTLEELYSTGMLDDSALRDLLGRSLRSGKTAMTSVIMSMIRRRMEEGSEDP